MQKKLPLDNQENLKPAPMGQGFQFQVVDYDRPTENTGNFGGANNGSQIQIGIMGATAGHKDEERNREIDMAELNALLGN